MAARFLVGEPDGDELHEFTVGGRHPHGPVASVGDPDRYLNQPAQDCGEGELRGQQHPGLDQGGLQVLGGR